MPIPDFNDDGDLPPGVYAAPLSEILGRFGQGSAHRRLVAGRLKRVYDLAVSTGQLGRCIVFGSFVTSKPDPNDVDVVLLMKDTFDISTVSGEVAFVFQHMDAEARFGASVFWTRCIGALGGEQAMIEHWQVRLEGGQRGIVEILPKQA